MKRIHLQLALAGLALLSWACSRGDASAARGATTKPPAHTETATLAGGCFWCLEAAYDDVPGVVEAVSGFTGGHKPNPTYEEVTAGGTGHYEAVRITFDPAKTSFAKILDVFWRQIDPTDPGGQFADRGPSYRTAIFVADAQQRRLAEASKKALEATGWFKKPIVTEILAAAPFYAAGAYHQNYDDKNPAAYKAYKWGSGRGPFIEDTWKGKPSILVPAAARTYVKPPDEELRKRLTRLQYDVTQHGATERAFANEYWDDHDAGIYVDIVSGEPLFSSADKFDSGTGWPSFSRPLVEDNVQRSDGSTASYSGVEVHSRVAKSHLGHVFGDGPEPTGLRYCINSASIRFIPASKLEAEGYGEFAGALSPE